ncbi:hypothetical protein COLO4_29322 [Corchorus olitorius]|uniref:Legume lectin domain-containing protein n=1 Tax=Corchorus olitorius TaxID=93759 RepID=A0A1R3HF39_9ROSI|nr:hypothetical protein COLO4_29322 [Corchorus olitorius]
MPFFQVSKLLLQATLIVSSLTQIQCLNFSYPSFSPADANDFVRLNSSIIDNVIQVSPVTADASGRILYKEPLKLWDKLKGTKSSFTSTFVINIKPQTSPGGEGLAFILTDSTTLPINSAGQWLGIVNQESLASHGVNLSSSEDITARIQYDAKSDKISVFVSLTRTSEQNMGNPVLSTELDLSEHLPQDVFIGFSGSTGEYVQVNAVKSWDFISFETRVKGSVNLVWLWILIPFIVVILLGGFGYLLYRRYKNRMKENDNDELEIEKEIQRSSSAPQKFRLKELKAATEWVWQHHRMGTITDVVDFRLDKDFDKDQAQCILVLGLACCHPNPFERPSMRTALQVLTGEVAAPSVPIEKPAFMWPAMAPNPIAVIREDMDSSISGGQLTATMDLSGR